MQNKELVLLLSQWSDEQLRSRLIAELSYFPVECACRQQTDERLRCAVNPCDCAGRCARCGGRVGASEEYK